MKRNNCNQFSDRLLQTLQISSIIFIFFLSFCNCKKPEPAAPAKACDHLLPGLNKLRSGVDITKLDLLPLKYNGGDGYKYPVLDFHCAEGKRRYIGSLQFDEPDEVSSIINLPGGYLNIDVNILKKSSDVLKMMSANIGFGSVVKGLFSASSSYKKMTANFYNESRYVENIISFQSTSRADLIPKFALQLGKYTQMFVDKYLPIKFEEDPQKYFEFIENFGTHYFSNVKFGGSFQLYLETMKSYYQGKSDKAIKAEASATFFKILNGFGGASHHVKKIDTKFTASSNQIIRYYGGDTNLLASGGLAKWQPTVVNNPWVYGGKLLPLSGLIKDQQKKKSLEKATEIHIDLAYLDSLSDNLHWASNKYPSSKQQIANYLKQVVALKKAKASNHKAVIDLGDKIEQDLEIPSWFYQQVELCYKWRPDGDGGQCGGGVGRNLCAKVGTMTTYYRDDTDRRNGGCRMQWGIMKPGTLEQSWLKQVQICYRWWPDGDGGQCGGGAARQLCAPINKFTPEYRDDTDRRSGGCQMQWKLIVPANAPIWLRNMKICYEWYADGDGGQCGGGADRLLCATTNSWTSAYRDDSDRRNGGCQMRWSIIPS